MPVRFQRVVAAFFALQLVVIGFLGNGPFSDEGTYVLAGTSALRSEEHYVGYDLWLDGTPYLFPVLSALGYSVGGLECSRVLTAALYCVGLLIYGRFVTRCFGPSAALGAIVLLCINGLFFSFAHLAVYDAAAFVGLTGCLLASVQLARSSGPRWAAWGAIFGALALVSKYSSFVLLLPCVPLAFVAAGRANWRYIAATVVGAIAIAALYMQWVHGTVVPPLVAKVLSEHEKPIDRPHLAFVIVHGMALPVLFAAFGAARLFRSRPALAVVMISAGLTFPLLHLLSNQIVSLLKHIALGSIYLYPLAALTFSRLWQQRRGLALGLAGFGAIWGSVQSFTQDRSWSDIRAVSSFLLPKLRREDSVAFGTGWDFGMYAVTARKLPGPRSVIDLWRFRQGGDDLCEVNWIVGIRPEVAVASQRGDLVNLLAQEAERCGFSPVARFPASRYYVWPPLIERAPIDFVVYRRPNAFASQWGVAGASPQ